MPLVSVKLPDMVTSAGGTVSSPITHLDDAWALSILTTAASFTSTAVRVQIEHTSTGTNFVTLLSGDDDVLVLANRARIISPQAFLQMRLEHSDTEGSEVVFHVRKLIVT